MNREASPSRQHHPDYVIAMLIAVLLSMGLILIYSISPILSQKLTGNISRNYYFTNQLKYIGIGLMGWIVATTIPYWNWRKWASPLLVISGVSLLALLIPGISNTFGGATRWINLGLFSFQPAEILKLALILYLAVWFEKRGTEIRSFADGFVPFVIMVGVACAVIVTFQRDMGTMMVIALAAVGMYYAAGMRWQHVLLVTAGGFAAAFLAIVAFPHRMQRITAFLHATQHCNDVAYQICQALLGVGSGGLFGVGLGHSIQVYGYLPEAANDSIYAIIGEEFGLLGSLLVIGLFGFLVYRGLKVASLAPDTFSRLAATGISLWLLFQAFINIGAMVSLLPLTGIPLPFISYGGTSLVISLFGAGILLNISKYTIREGTNADNRQRRGISRTHIANARGQRRVTFAK